MRRLALALSVLLPSHTLAEGGAPPTEVAYALGGLVSGPYRVTADLVAGTVSEARAPRGTLGDGAGRDAWTMPETSRRALPPPVREEIARLAIRVRRDGPVRDRLCAPSADAIGVFRVVSPEGTWEGSASGPCFSGDATALLRALTCAADPSRDRCG